jgi:hypothetical protein
MYRHWHRFGFGLLPSSIWFLSPRCFPHREEYIRMLEEYQSELKAELEELKKTG